MTTKTTAAQPPATVAQILARPFAPEQMEWLAYGGKSEPDSEGNVRRLILPNVDPRHYQARLDELAALGVTWSSTSTLVQLGMLACATVALTLAPNGVGEPVTRSGEGAGDLTAPGLFTASAQAFRRACSAHGLGRYLYTMPKVKLLMHAGFMADDGPPRALDADLTDVARALYGEALAKLEAGS